jgi:hypothetical protein
MKVWYGHGSEHSANLVIIGTFQTEHDAEETERLIADMVEVALADAEDGNIEAGEHSIEFSQRQMDAFKRLNFASFGYDDPQELLYEHDVRREGDRIVITTEEQDVSALLKMLLHGGAKIEVYSAHAYPSSYGRPTYTADE